jgi:hypothetical protein
MRGAHASMRAAQARVDLGSLPERIAALQSMTMREPRDVWAQVFGHATASHNHAYLRKKIAWRLQEIAEGGLSARARTRIEELAPFAPIRHRAPSHPPPAASPAPSPARARDPRLPPAGTVLARAYQGAHHEVTVLEKGFDYRGVAYSSLSAIAKAITGTPWNGLVFFGLVERGARKAGG